MAEEDTTPEPEFVETSESVRREIMREDLSDPVKMLERVNQIWWRWADFHLYITSPAIAPIVPPLLIEPEKISKTEEYEHVYNIYDHGDKLTTSKSEEMYTAGMSMCKLYYTIEKMIAMLVERLQSAGIDETSEVQVAFGGFIMAQRKAFESIINLPYNIVVSNFEPGEWGDSYLEAVKQAADRGYGYPSETPRDNYKLSHEKAGRGPQ